MKIMPSTKRALKRITERLSASPVIVSMNNIAMFTGMQQGFTDISFTVRGSRFYIGGKEQMNWVQIQLDRIKEIKEYSLLVFKIIMQDGTNVTISNDPRYLPEASF